ncbi:MAG TPA: NAD-dependent epimerase/dehydratase family protein [Anaerolineaceae bacterium]|jgi:nucleoside-diphosphate-sugar epimerase
MRIVIIGGTGHIGTYLAPRLVEAGHQVAVISRSQRQPYQPHAAWKQVEMIVKERELEEARGAFGKFVLSLEPDAVIDLICFKIDSARQLVSALKGQVQHFIHCGTIWIYGPSSQVPASEDQPRRPFGDYGIQKAAIETYLLKEARVHGFPATLLHPGHIVGPGWAPVNPAGNFNPAVYTRLARGEELALPNLGMETVHHVHADDVAQAFVAALDHRSAALGESFHVVSPAAITLRGYAEAVAAWFGQTPQLKFLPWEEWRGLNTPEDAASTWDHIAHSPNASIDKARRLLGYQPRYSSLQAVYEAVQELIAQGKIQV